MLVNNEQVKFNVYETMKHPYNEDSSDYYFIDHCDTCISEMSDLQVLDDIEDCLIGSANWEDYEKELRERERIEKTRTFLKPKWHKHLDIELNPAELRPSIEVLPTNLELKPLPPHLK